MSNNQFKKQADEIEKIYDEYVEGMRKLFDEQSFLAAGLISQKISAGEELPKKHE